jgi:hypothetical protein
LIADLLKPYWKKLEESVAVALNAIDAALKAERTDKADHQVRLRATERLSEYLELAPMNSSAGCTTHGKSSSRRRNGKRRSRRPSRRARIDFLVAMGGIQKTSEGLANAPGASWRDARGNPHAWGGQACGGQAWGAAAPE